MKSPINFAERLQHIQQRYEQLVTRENEQDYTWDNGIFNRYQHPVLTNEHAPFFWRYDLDEQTNPYLMERLGVNTVLNPGAIEIDGKICLICRVEGADRKSFFAVAESANGIDQFRFWDYPIIMPETENPDVNVYDMRVVQHEDGWIYGLFCTERHDPQAAAGDTSSAVAACGIARTRDMRQWERLPDLISRSPQQRNVVLHPEFIGGKYALYTRPQDGFIETGGGGGICWALCDDMTQATIDHEVLLDSKIYHTIKEVKNGAGAAPIKTPSGWLHIAHGVRNTAAGLRYVIYAFLCDLAHPEVVTHRPSGYFIAPYGEERVGDVSNVVFTNGLIARATGEVFIYYASADTRIHVATTTMPQLLDYVLNTPEDPYRSFACVEQRCAMIAKNLQLMEK